MNENEKLPCSNCWNAEGDKTTCVDHCARLAAYQYNKPWYHIPPYKEVKMEQKEEVIPAWQCLIEGCNNVGNRRGLCERHYDSWRKGYIEHPKEKAWQPNRKTRHKKIVVQKILKHGISDEALRSVQPSLEAAVKRIEGRYNPQETHTVKAILDEEDFQVTTIDLRIITIDLVKYPELYEKIMQDANRNYVPVSHTIINLLSIGMQVVEMSAKKE